MRITILALIRVHRRERMIRENSSNRKVGKLVTLDPSMRLLLCVAVSLYSSVTAEKRYDRCIICYKRPAVEQPVTSVISALRDRSADSIFNVGNGIIFESHPNTLSDMSEEVQQRQQQRRQRRQAGG